MALAQSLVGVELLGARQRFGFPRRSNKNAPKGSRSQWAERVLLGLMGGDQGRADARVETNLLVDGSGVTLKGSGVSPLGLAKHRADQTIKHIDGSVRPAQMSRLTATSVACRLGRS